MRRAAKVDANQDEIVRAVRACGATVQSLAVIGKGCPDILVGWRGRNLLWEIKDGALPPSRRRLTDDEIRWAAVWRGRVETVESIARALEIMRGVK